MKDTRRPKVNSCISQELRASKQAATSYFLLHAFKVNRANNFRKLSHVPKRAQHQAFPPFTTHTVSRTHIMRTVSKARLLSLDSAPHMLCQVWAVISQGNKLASELQGLFHPPAAHRHMNTHEVYNVQCHLLLSGTAWVESYGSKKKHLKVLWGHSESHGGVGFIKNNATGADQRPCITISLWQQPPDAEGRTYKTRQAEQELSPSPARCGQGLPKPEQVSNNLIRFSLH